MYGTIYEKIAPEKEICNEKKFDQSYLTVH